MQRNRVKGSRSALSLIFTSMVSVGIAGLASGQTKAQAPAAKTETPAMTREAQIAQQEKMIGMHTKMLECLKTDKPIEECQQEMMQTCATIHGGACPMMEMGQGMHGMMGKGAMHRGNMMNQGGSSQGAAPATSKPAPAPKK